MPDIRSTLNEDLYLVFEGVNPDNGHPILKAHLNALVMWIWMGVWIMLDRNGSGLGSKRARAGHAFPPRARGGAPNPLPWPQEIELAEAECGDSRPRLSAGRSSDVLIDS